MQSSIFNNNEHFQIFNEKAQNNYEMDIEDQGKGNMYFNDEDNFGLGYLQGSTSPQSDQEFLPYDDTIFRNPFIEEGDELDVNNLNPNNNFLFQNDKIEEIEQEKSQTSEQKELTDAEAAKASGITLPPYPWEVEEQRPEPNIDGTASPSLTSDIAHLEDLTINTNVNIPNHDSLEVVIDEDKEKAKKTRPRQTTGDQKSRYRPDNLRTKVQVFAISSLMSFGNFVLNLYSQFKDQLLLRKIHKDEIGISARTTKSVGKNKFQDFRKKTLAQIFQMKISNDYKNYPEDQNKKNYEKFLTFCKDQVVISLMSSMTFEQFYKEVFINGRNPLGFRDDKFQREVKTFESFVTDKNEKGKQGFNDQEYIKLLRECAKTNFLGFYSKSGY